MGRPTGTEDAKGTTTEIAYKRCGLRDYTTSGTGDTVYSDPFGKVSKIIHKDNSKILSSMRGRKSGAPLALGGHDKTVPTLQ